MSVKQNDTQCLEVIQKYGCFFTSCGYIAQDRLEVTRELTAEDLNKTWMWAKNTKRIDEDDNIRDSASIATRFLRLLGDEKGRFVEVGLFKDGVVSYYPAYKNTELARTDALIQKITQNGPSKYHFRIVSCCGLVLEDPHEPPINATGICYSILYAYDKGE